MLIKSKTITVAQDVFIPSTLEDFQVIIWKLKGGSTNKDKKSLTTNNSKSAN